jgi:hypothetical protein
VVRVVAIGWSGFFVRCTGKERTCMEERGSADGVVFDQVVVTKLQSVHTTATRPDKRVGVRDYSGISVSNGCSLSMNGC